MNRVLAYNNKVMHELTQGDIDVVSESDVSEDAKAVSVVN
jgi:hypothetical protein